MKAKRIIIAITTIGLAGILFASIGFYVYQFHNAHLSKETTNWGAFGGYVNGIIGTSFSILSAILIYLTYNNQVKVAVEQRKDSQLQQFENTFFNLLRLQREIVKSLYMDRTGIIPEFAGQDVLSGSEYLNVICNRICYQLEQKFKDDNSDNLDEIQQKITEVYTSVSTGEEAMLWHYLRHLYHFIKYVDESPIDNKLKYINIISAQMDDNEHYIAFYNCISLDHGAYNFKPLVDDYNFFENLNSRNQLFEKHKIFFPKTTFKSKFKNNNTL